MQLHCFNHCLQGCCLDASTARWDCKLPQHSALCTHNPSVAPSEGAPERSPRCTDACRAPWNSTCPRPPPLSCCQAQAASIAATSCQGSGKYFISAQPVAALGIACPDSVDGRALRHLISFDLVLALPSGSCSNSLAVPRTRSVGASPDRPLRKQWKIARPGAMPYHKCGRVKYRLEPCLWYSLMMCNAGSHSYPLQSPISPASRINGTPPPVKTNVRPFTRISGS